MNNVIASLSIKISCVKDTKLQINKLLFEIYILIIRNRTTSHIATLTGIVKREREEKERSCA